MIRKLKKSTSHLIYSLVLGALFTSSTFAEEVVDAHYLLPPPSEGYTIQFDDVPVIEFIRFVSKISEENFIYDHKDMDFNISLSTGKAIDPAKVVQALIQLLKVHGFNIRRQAGYYVIRKWLDDKEPTGLLASSDLKMGPYSDPDQGYEFLSYKIQYHEGSELEESLKKIAADLRNQADAPLKLINAIQSLQWVKATNSLLCSADAQTLAKLRHLIETVDVP
ncbi:MAG: hypothetical protein HYZ48_01185, partial [Chlamydiales bacterium]|nr:hypothetical protein [Chlamydiales bacterium]